MLDTGLHRVFISLGADGVFAADQSGSRCSFCPLPGAMVNTTGCGDAFMAAITWAYLQGTDLNEARRRRGWPPPSSPWSPLRPSTPP
ncbi:MAG: PfkB family carbohydrate kinase [Dysosmobacter sp.]